jgi:predicted SAM-dependent methyltransferase
MDVTKEILPFPSESVDGIIANHVIEHMKWTEIKPVIADWFRVLKKGASLKIRTPNLEFIVKNYLNGVQTKEHPVDENAVKEIFGNVGPSEIALIKLFSGQDYDSNVHYACYDFKMLSALLKNVGFTRVQKEHFGSEFSPGELQVVAYKIIS